MGHKDGIAAMVYSAAACAAIPAVSARIGAAVEFEEALATACKKAERSVLKISMSEIEAEAKAVADSTGMTCAEAARHVVDRKIWQKNAAVAAYEKGCWAEAGIPFDMFAKYMAMCLAERERHRAELYPDNAAGICPGGCLYNYADPLPHCPGCSIRCTSYENGGADNGGLSPAT